MAGKLTVLGMRGLVKPGRYVDGDGLHLHVRGSDRRVWVFRYTRQGTTKDMGLGPYPDVTLAKAPEAAAAARELLRETAAHVRERSSPPCPRALALGHG